MNHILQLQADKAGLENKLKIAQDGLADLLFYVQSGKFESNTYVEKGDIILRVREIQTAIWRAE